MTNWLATLFHRGGPTLFVIEYLAAPALLIALFHVIAPRSWARWAVVAIIGLVLAIGLFGTVQGRHRTDEAIERDRKEARNPDDKYPPPTEAELRERRAAGYDEAYVPIEFAGVVAGALALLVAIGELRLRARRDRI
jgi:hypothetical protein